MYIKQTVFLES